MLAPTEISRRKLTATQTVDISANQDGQITITKRKSGAKPNQVSVRFINELCVNGQQDSEGRRPPVFGQGCRWRGTMDEAKELQECGANAVQVASSNQAVTLKRGTGPRRANKIAAAETAGKGYRADLRQVSGRLLDKPSPRRPFHPISGVHYNMSQPHTRSRVRTRLDVLMKGGAYKVCKINPNIVPTFLVTHLIPHWVTLCWSETFFPHPFRRLCRHVGVLYSITDESSGCRRPSIRLRPCSGQDQQPPQAVRRQDPWTQEGTKGRCAGGRGRH